MKKLMLGNEAVARGAYEAGVHVVASYPGTPSTEITEFCAKYPEMNCEWAPNEKVASEVAFGAAMAGARSMTCMKHVGVNVAADPLFTAAYTGGNGGMVFVCADDPAMHSSQNEQDSRFYARSAHVPMLEPSDSQECKDFTKLAFELSEAYDTPVFVRVVTRIAHARSAVEMEERQQIAVKSFDKNPQKYVMMPGMARKRHPVVEAREKQLALDGCSLPVNRVEMGDAQLGVICAGTCYQYVKEALPQASVLKLGLVHPLPMNLIREFAQQVNRLIVIEELEGFMEEQIAAAGIPVEGKTLTGLQGELSVNKLRAIFGESVPEESAQALPARPPVLCPGCPHRGAFYAMKKLKLNVFGDIGCYTMAALPPLGILDACLCMGASVGMAFGAEKAQGKDFSRHSVAVLGDSTFIHSGITSLIDSVYNGGTTTVVILDNRITAMTGHQPNPATGKNILGEPAPQVDLEALCKAAGVKHVRVVDPFDLPAMTAALKEETAREAVSVIIARRPCALLIKEKVTPCHIENCRNCGVCMGLGCPALQRTPEGVRVDTSLCTGCGLCMSVCPFNAIHKEEN
ncbi:MAG: indolepyruvate ferredoxin oxidoreductase subunit alpha [Clostridia bacterium]|nr:indolepyruvate ferredoxin oxidoreductase subunit alpha [Clostridia bacterium]